MKTQPDGGKVVKVSGFHKEDEIRTPEMAIGPQKG